MTTENGKAPRRSRAGLFWDAKSHDCTYSMKDLTVLSNPLDPFRQDTPENHRKAQWFAEQVARFLPDGRITSGDRITNSPPRVT